LILISLLLLIAGLLLWRYPRPTGERSAAEVPAAPVVAEARTDGAPAPFAPPAHSIAVLPFVNLSADPEQEYFSDGLTEELLNSLSAINDLQVAVRTSSFSFKEHPDIATVARKLNVASILEGSVRRSAQTVRITAQLINARTGYHVWSKTYDRDLSDVLKLQTEIATAVANALKVTLLSDVSTKIELGGTRNPAAFDAYLRGSKLFGSIRDSKDLPAAISAYTDAIRLDPSYALAFANRSRARAVDAQEEASDTAIREGFEKAMADARQSIALAPALALGHLALAPGKSQVLSESGEFAIFMGHFDVGLAAVRHAVVLDPLSRSSHAGLVDSLYLAHQYAEAITASAELMSVAPGYKAAYSFRGLAYYGLGNLKSALESCRISSDYWMSQQCLAVAYDKLGRHADAEAEVAKMKAVGGDAAAYQYATIYAQWGIRSRALQWLDTAMRLPDPGLITLKTDPLLDPLRNEPRFQAIERELRFPN
jgi:TolB-like protein